MTTPTETKAAIESDAQNRAVRSFLWGLMIDVAVAVVLVLATAFNAIEWTKEYWTILGLTLAKSVLQAGVSYFMRKLVKPPLSQS